MLVFSADSENAEMRYFANFGRLPKVSKSGVYQNYLKPHAGRSAEMAVNIENTETPHAGRSAKIAGNIKNTKNLGGGRPAEIAVNIENTESSSFGRPAKIAVNLQFCYLRHFRPF